MEMTRRHEDWHCHLTRFLIDYGSHRRYLCPYVDSSFRPEFPIDYED